VERIVAGSVDTPSSPQTSAAPTIHDVARATGLSAGTVSKALNGRGHLRPETRSRVQQAAQRLEFRPNELAKSLLRKRSFTVGVLSSDTYGRFSLPVFRGIEDALEEAQIATFLCNARDDRHERDHVHALLAKMVDGVVVTGRRIDPRPPLSVRNLHVPVVYAFAQATGNDSLSIIPDDKQGGMLAARHLLLHGRRRIAHITGPQGFQAVGLRLEGLERGLADHGVELPANQVLFGPWEEGWGRHAARMLLQRKADIDAVFCGSDQLARGAVDGLREIGVRVPDDVAVIGFDNWEVMAKAARPPLTTVDANLYHLGRTAGTRLLRMIDGDPESGVVRMPCRLVVRESSETPSQLGVGASPAGDVLT
jgi:LacI family transcriptional regulator